MALQNPPKYRYPLFDPWDKEVFEFIKDIGKNRNYPILSGTQEGIEQFLITLIRAQKSLHDWRAILKDIIIQAKDGLIDTTALNHRYPPESISTDTPSWVTYKEDQIVNDFIDELTTRKIKFTGSAEQMGELVVRFILSQLGNDWELTILMIWEMLGDEDTLAIVALNQELKKFDYMNLLP